MPELVQVLLAGSLWIFVFLLLAVAANKKTGNPLICGIGILWAYPLFAFFQVFLIKSLDWMHSLNSWTIFGGHLLLAMVLLIFIARTKPSLEPQEPNEPYDVATKRIVLWCSAIFLAILAVISLVIPVYYYDDNFYHMPMVANYFQNQSLADWATQSLHQISRPYAIELQSANIAFMSKSDAWVQLPNLLAIFVSLVAVFQIAKTVLGRKNLAYLCVVLTLTAHQILLAPSTASNDAPLMAFILCAFYWVIHTVTKPPQKIWPSMALLGLSVGLAVATKVMGVCVLVAIVAALILLGFTKALPLRALGWFLVFALGSSLILVGDVFWQNFRGEILPVGLMPEEYQFRGIGKIKNIAQFYIRELCLERLTTKYTLSYGDHHYGYLFPLILLFGGVQVAYELFQSKKRVNSGMWVLALLSAFLFISITCIRNPQPYDQRFMVWMVPSLSVLALFTLRHWQPKKTLGLIIICSLISLGSLLHVYTTARVSGLLKNTLQYISLYQKLPRLVNLFNDPQIKTEDQYIANFIEGYKVLEKEATKGDRILYVGGKKTWMYPAWGQRFTRIVHGVKDTKDALQKIKSKKYSFILIEIAETMDENLRNQVLAALKEAGYHDQVQINDQIIATRTPPTEGNKHA